MGREPSRTVRPELKALVAEASQALARLDAARLEELAASCRALSGEAAPGSVEESALLAEEARAAVGEMAVLGRVLEATRANIRVMKRLRELRLGRLEYSEPPFAASGWSASESEDGDD